MGRQQFSGIHIHYRCTANEPISGSFSPRYGGQLDARFKLSPLLTLLWKCDWSFPQRLAPGCGTRPRLSSKAEHR